MQSGLTLDTFMKLTKHHISQNLINIIFLPICIGLIILSFTHPAQSQFQLRVALSAFAIYLVLPTTHHYFDKSLTREILFEYILVGSLAFLALLVFVL